MLELRADGALRWETKSISIKLRCSLKIVDAESTHGDASSHRHTGLRFKSSRTRSLVEG